MVDWEARRKYAEIIRQFISGRMTNGEYEARFEAIQHDAKDLAISAVYYELWFLHDDIKTHRMTGAHRLDRENRRIIARIVLFLQSATEYQWPNHAWIGAGRAAFLAMEAWATVILIGMFPADFLLILSIVFPLAFLTIAYLGIRVPLERRAWESQGDQDAWPFLHQADLAEAGRHPHLLNGKRTMP